MLKLTYACPKYCYAFHIVISILFTVFMSAMQYVNVPLKPKCNLGDDNIINELSIKGFVQNPQLLYKFILFFPVSSVNILFVVKGISWKVILTEFNYSVYGY